MASDPRDWTEDFTHENGQYMCRCTTCSHTFIGHKRRVTCRLCAQPTNPTLALQLDDARAEPDTEEEDTDNGK